MTDMKLKNEKERIDLGNTFIMFCLCLTSHQQLRSYGDGATA